MRANRNVDTAQRGLVLTRAIAIACVLLALAVSAWLLTRFWAYTMDDAYITFRYSSNFAAGRGLVFNPDNFSRAEGITSPLYALILSLAPLAGADIVLLAKALGAASALLTGGIIGVLIYRIATTMTRLPPVPATLFGCAGFAQYVTDPYVVANAVSGMETSLASLSVAAFLLSIIWGGNPIGKMEATRIIRSPSPHEPEGPPARCRDRKEQPKRRYWILPELSSKNVLPRSLLTGVLAVLVPMIRPEMGLFVVVLLGLSYLFCAEERFYILTSFLAFALIGAVYFCLRAAYYGALLPLPFYVKQSGSGKGGIADLSEYLMHVLPLLLGVFLCVSFALVTWRSSQRPRGSVWLVPLVAALGVQLAYYGTIWHIMGFGFRYFQPVQVVLVSLAYAGLGICYRIVYERKRFKAWAGAICFFFTCGLLSINTMGYEPAYRRLIDWYANLANPGVIRAQKIRDAAMGRPLSIALFDCGTLPYFTGFTTIDLGGLNNRAIAFHNRSVPVRGRSVASREEIRKAEADLVVLVSNEAHGQDKLKGWERLTSADLIGLGYWYAGTMKADSNYHLLLYVNSSRSYDEFLDRLVASGVLNPSSGA